MAINNKWNLTIVAFIVLVLATTFGYVMGLSEGWSNGYDAGRTAEVAVGKQEMDELKRQLRLKLETVRLQFDSAQKLLADGE